MPKDCCENCVSNLFLAMFPFWKTNSFRVKCTEVSTGRFLLRCPENLDEVSDCYPFVLFTVWHKLKAVKAKERWLPEQEASHLRSFHNVLQPVRGAWCT